MTILLLRSTFAAVHSASICSRVMPRRSTTQAGSESSGSLHGLELIVRTAGEQSGEVLHGERFSIVLVNDGLAVKREVYGHLVKHETGARVVRVLS